MQMVPAVALALSTGIAGAQDTTRVAPRARSARPPIEGQMGGAMMRRGGPPDMGMRMSGAGPAGRILGLRSQLGLSADQVSRLEALQKSQAASIKPRSSDALRARADLMDAEQKGDLNAAHAIIDRIAKQRADDQFAQLQARKTAAEVLTADQKAKLEQFRGARRHGGMRGGRGRRGGARVGGGAGGFGPGIRGRGPGGGGFRGGMMMPRRVPPMRPDSGQ